MSDGMRREFTYLSSHATNRYFIPNWGKPINGVMRNVAPAVHVFSLYFSVVSNVRSGCILNCLNL